MKLRGKALAMVALSMFSLMVIMSVAAQRILLDSFAELERREAAAHVERVQSLLRERLAALRTVVTDWASWDDTYKFVASRDPAFVESNFTDATFKNIRVPLVLILDTEGGLIEGRLFDPAFEGQVPMPPALAAALAGPGSLARHPGLDSVKAGLFMLEDSPLLLVSLPITTSNNEGPIRGAVIMGRYLDQEAVRRLSEAVLAEVELIALDKRADLPPPERQAVENLLAGGSVQVLALGPRQVAGYVLFRDLFGRPALVIKAAAPRDIWTQAQATLLYFLLALLAVGVAASLATLFFWDRIILSRLSALSRRVGEIGAGGDLGARLGLAGSDELASLAQRIDGMLEALESAESRYRDLLMQTQKMQAVGTLAGGVAHDFNNILTGILGNLSLAGAKLEPGHAAARHLQTAATAGERAAAIIQQLLAFSRKARPHPRPLSLRGPMEETLGLLSATVDRRIQLVGRAADGLALVMADGGQMSQLVMNLCVNAKDAIEEMMAEPADQAPPGQWLIEVRLDNVTLGDDQALRHPEAKAGDYVRLRVSDNGRGMDQATLERLFEPFFTTKPPGKGTGLGLSTVYGIARQHGGWVEVSSRPGQGATFDVFIPSLEAGARETPVEEPKEELPRGQETILLADDEAMIREMGREVLEGLGYRVLLAGDGAEALEEWTRNRAAVDLTILDLTMPRLSGQEVMERILAMEPRARIILSSGDISKYAAGSGGSLERAAACISKPYRLQALAAVVRQVLDRPK